LGFDDVFRYSSTPTQHTKADDISLKYGNFTIFRMAVIRHTGISNFANFHIRPLSISDFAFSYKISRKTGNPLTNNNVY